MKVNEKKPDTKKTTAKKANLKSEFLSDKILAYCGYKLEGNKLVSTGNYNPVPYQGL